MHQDPSAHAGNPEYRVAWGWVATFSKLDASRFAGGVQQHTRRRFRRPCRALAVWLSRRSALFGSLQHAYSTRDAIACVARVCECQPLGLWADLMEREVTTERVGTLR